MWTAATSGNVVTINSVTPAAGTTDWRLYFAGFIQTNGNVAPATSINSSGLTAVLVNTMVFSELKIGVIQGFTNTGLRLDGTPTIFNPQTVLHSHVRLGQVVYNGYGIYQNSTSAATSNVEGITFDIQNIYGNNYSIAMYGQATSSSVYRIGALDEVAAGSVGIYCEGGWNTFYIGYANAPIQMAAISLNNTLTAGNTIATGVSFSDLGTENHLFSAGVDFANQLGSYLRLDQISPPTASVSFGNQSVNFIRNILVTGSGSGAITLQPQAAAGTYNWNWPTTAGSAGQTMLSGGGSSNPMTWGSFNGGLTNNSGNIQLALNNATLQANAGAPTGTVSTSNVMMGMGTTCKLTPVYSGRINVKFIAAATSSVAGNFAALTVKFGTGAAPSNGAAVSGTSVGQALAATSITAGAGVPYNIGGLVTGLTPGTAYWFDVAVSSSSGSSTATPGSPACTLEEF